MCRQQGQECHRLAFQDPNWGMVIYKSLVVYWNVYDIIIQIIWDGIKMILWTNFENIFKAYRKISQHFNCHGKKTIKNVAH